MSGKVYRVIVVRVVKNGPHGPYAVGRSEDIGSVTFSLDKPVWKEKRWPETGTVVILSQIIQKRAGWRAQLGRFARPSDEARSKKQ